MAKVATFLPLFPLVILLILAAMTISGVSNFKPDMLTADAARRRGQARPPSVPWGLILFCGCEYRRLFRHGGGCGRDIASSNRNEKDVSTRRPCRLAGATIFTGCLALGISAPEPTTNGHKLVATGPINNQFE